MTLTEDLTSLLTIVDRADFFTSDSRLVVPGAIFVALSGGQQDGHQFISEVITKRALAVVVSRVFAEQKASLFALHPNTVFCVVEDTSRAHRQLAQAFRLKFKTRILAVGGSAGKTTTKEFLFDLISPYFKAFKTQASQNGEQGIPKTLEQLRVDSEIGVVEIGIDNIGDMQRHVELVRPDIAALTSIGEEHLQHLKDIATVFAEERRLLDWTLSNGGTAFVPLNDPWLQKFTEASMLHRVPGNPAELCTKFISPFFENHTNTNLVLALSMARHLGLSDNQLIQGISQLKVPQGRGRIEKIRDDFLIVTDFYNSNPDSLRAGLKALLGNPSFGGFSKHLVLGDMFDLGEATQRAHDSVVEMIFGVHPKSVFLVGKEMSRIAPLLKGLTIDSFPNTEVAAEALSSLTFQGVVYLKASRGMYFEKIYKAILN